MAGKALASMALKMAGNKMKWRMGKKGSVAGHSLGSLVRAQPGVCSHLEAVRNGAHLYFIAQNFITENVAF